MRIIRFAGKAEEDIQSFKGAGQLHLLEKVKHLLANVVETPFEGLGKPEPLKGNLQGRWSRRISAEHRLVYEVTEELVIVYSLKGHYERG